MSLQYSKFFPFSKVALQNTTKIWFFIFEIERNRFPNSSFDEQLSDYRWDFRGLKWSQSYVCPSFKKKCDYFLSTSIYIYIET